MAAGISGEHELRELLQKATDPSSEDIDELAVHLFCSLIRQDQTLARKSTEMLVTKIKSTNVTQSRKALELLEECMSKCGPEFQTTVARFQFLNELIRLVSNKFSGDDTPAEIRNKILDCLSLWTVQYPERTKIKEVYETLRRSGVQHEVPPTIAATCKRPTTLMDDGNEKILKKLLKSTNREDLQRANLLIQYLVKQDSKKCELTARQQKELQEARNSAALLNQILDRWIEDNHVENQELAKEVYMICKKSKTVVMQIPEMIEDDEILLGDAIDVNDNLHTVIEKYENSLIHKKPEKPSTTSVDVADLMSVSNTIIPNTLDDLSDIFSQSNSVTSATDNSFDLLQPISVECAPKKSERSKIGTHDQKILETEPQALAAENISSPVQFGPNLPGIDKLSADLFKVNLDANERIGSFKKAAIKVPIKDLPTQNKQHAKDSESPASKSTNSFDVSRVSLDDLFKKADQNDTTLELDAFWKDQLELDEPLGSKPVTNGVLGQNEPNDVSLILADFDDLAVKTLSDKLFDSDDKTANQYNKKPIADDEEIVTIDEDIKRIDAVSVTVTKTVKHLSEIKNLELSTIQPSNELPRIVLDDFQGLRVTLNFALDRPCPNVSVIVISTINQSSSTIDDYQLDASVPKPCKLRLLSATKNSLPAVKPFRPPTDDIQQILLLSNPTKKSVDITCIFGYRLGEDPDPVKESVVVRNIPYCE